MHYFSRSTSLKPFLTFIIAASVVPTWSNVRAHLDGRLDPLLTPGPLADRLGEAMPQFFDLDVNEEAKRALRRASSTGRPVKVEK